MITTCNTGSETYRRASSFKKSSLDSFEENTEAWYHRTTHASSNTRDTTTDSHSAAFFIRAESDDDVTSEGTSSSGNNNTVGGFRPDLDYEEQVSQYASDKWVKQSEYNQTMQRQGELCHHTRRVGLNILVNEAHRLHQHEIRKSSHSHRTSTSPHRECPELFARWKRIGRQAMEDVDVYGHHHVIRNLSCMCIFVEGRQAVHYGEHEEDRTKRITQQCEILNKLHVQRLKGNLSCFVE